MGPGGRGQGAGATGLVPAAKKYRVEDPRIGYVLSIEEGGETAQLHVDCRALYDAGMTDGDIFAATDEVSGMVLGSMTSDYTVDGPGLIRLAIKGYQNGL